MGALDDKPFGATDQDGSMGDKDEAMRVNNRYDGPASQDLKFEGVRPNGAASAAQMSQSGHD